MNRLWKVLIIISLVYGLIHQNTNNMMISLLESPLSTFELVIKIVINGSLWNGFLNIANESTLLEKFSNFIKPIFKFLYKEIDVNDEAFNYLSANFVANLFGLGSLATMSGLKAMKRLDEINSDKKKPSRSMATLMIFNTTGFSLFPSTILSIRSNYETNNPSDFIPYVILIGFITLVVGLIIQKVIEHD